MLEIPSILPDILNHLFCKYTRHYVTYHILFSQSDSEIPQVHGEFLYFSYSSSTLRICMYSILYIDVNRQPDKKKY